jgi:hypothetical protein
MSVYLGAKAVGAVAVLVPVGVSVWVCAPVEDVAMPVVDAAVPGLNESEWVCAPEEEVVPLPPVNVCVCENDGGELRACVPPVLTVPTTTRSAVSSKDAVVSFVQPVGAELCRNTSFVPAGKGSIPVRLAPSPVNEVAVIEAEDEIAAVFIVPLTVTFPDPFGVIEIPTFESPPDACIVGLFPVAALVIVISLTAEAVVPNFRTSLLSASLISDSLLTSSKRLNIVLPSVNMNVLPPLGMTTPVPPEGLNVRSKLPVDVS